MNLITLVQQPIPNPQEPNVNQVITAVLTLLALSTPQIVAWLAAKKEREREEVATLKQLNDMFEQMQDRYALDMRQRDEERAIMQTNIRDIQRKAEDAERVANELKEQLERERESFQRQINNLTTELETVRRDLKTVTDERDRLLAEMKRSV